MDEKKRRALSFLSIRNKRSEQPNDESEKPQAGSDSEKAVKDASPAGIGDPRTKTPRRLQPVPISEPPLPVEAGEEDG